jgi:transposase InsO family protein
VLKIYERCNQKNSIQFVDYAPTKLPFSVHSIQTDNGIEFGPQFHWHLLDKGIEHRYIKPRSPRLNGKVERSHRIDEEEFYPMLEVVVIDNCVSLMRSCKIGKTFIIFTDHMDHLEDKLHLRGCKKN